MSNSAERLKDSTELSPDLVKLLLEELKHAAARLNRTTLHRRVFEFLATLNRPDEPAPTATTAHTVVEPVQREAPTTSASTAATRSSDFDEEAGFTEFSSVEYERKLAFDALAAAAVDDHDDHVNGDAEAVVESTVAQSQFQGTFRVT